MKICNLKINVSCEASVKFQRISQNATPATLSPLHAALTMRFAQNDDGLQSVAPATKNAAHLLKTSQEYCACHKKTILSRSETCLNVTKCHACHAKRSYATFETLKSDPFCGNRHRHGHTALARTVADGCATSSEHTLNPQTPRVKREPLLYVFGKNPLSLNPPT